MTTAHACHDNGLECCAYCWQRFGDDHLGPRTHVGWNVNLTHGPVVHATDGHEYDHVGASTPGTALAHPDCYKEWIGRVDDENVKLTEYEQ